MSPLSRGGLGPQDPRLTWPPEREGWVLAYPA